MARESLFTLPRWSFGLRQLFLWMAAIAVGLVALRSATMTWVAATLGLAIAVLAASILLVIYRRGASEPTGAALPHSDGYICCWYSEAGRLAAWRMTTA